MLCFACKEHSMRQVASSAKRTLAPKGFSEGLYVLHRNLG